MVEKRRLERFDLTAPARVTVEPKSGEKKHLNLTTKNISSSGAYLYCPQHFPKGSRVKMELLISVAALKKATGDNGRAKIKVQGSIIRVDPDGIVVRFESKYKITALESGYHEIGVL
jgi:hypothetical protein